MRPLEIVLCCFTLLALIVWIAGMRPAVSTVRIFCLLFLVVLVAQIIWEGAHWQLVPLYLASLVCIGITFRLRSAPQNALRWLAFVCILLMCLSLLFSYLLPMFRLPTPTGKYAVGTRLLYLVDPSRDAMGLNTSTGKRELMVQVWYPAQPNGEARAIYRRWQETTRVSSYQSVLRTDSYWNAQIAEDGAPHPLLLFNPAWTGQRTQSTFLMQELASHGFIVASIDHTYYSGRVAFPDGRVIDASLAPDLGNLAHVTVEEELALGAKYTRIEAEDDIFVLDQLQALNQQRGSVGYKRLDLTRVGALGHSIGGAAAAEACYMDPRIRAAVNMDGWMFGQSLTQGLAKPFMLIFEKGDKADREPPDLSKLSETEQRYWEMNRVNASDVEAGLHRYGGYLITIDGTSHWNFSDRALYSPLRKWTDAGPIMPKRAYNIISQYTLAFFSSVLNGEHEPLLQGNAAELPEAQFKRLEAHPE